MTPKNIKLMLSELINQEGVRGAVVALRRAIKLHADEMSDLGLKEQAINAAEVSEILADLVTSIDE